MKRPITINNKNITKIINDIKKKLNKFKDFKIRFCDNHKGNKPAVCWIRNKNLCEDCMVDFYRQDSIYKK